MNTINLGDLIWLRTYRNGYLYPCTIIDPYTIKLLLSNKILHRKNENEEHDKKEFWDDRYWNSIFMREFKGENCAALWNSTASLIFYNTYFNINSNNTIIKEATSLFLKIKDKFNDYDEMKYFFIKNFHEYLMKIELTEEKLKELIVEMQNIDKDFNLWYGNYLNCVGIDFSTDFQKKKMFLNL